VSVIVYLKENKGRTGKFYFTEKERRGKNEGGREGGK
jgi:hypothetical protein